MQAWRVNQRLLGTLWLMILLLAACAKPPPTERVAFSEALRERYRLEDAQLRGIQYYISHQIVLERAVAGGTRRVESGRLIVRGGTTIAQVVLPPGTPGWIEEAGFVGQDDRKHVVEVSFALDAPLRFSPVEPGGVYGLSALPRKATGTLADFFASRGRSQRFQVTFAGEPWRVVAGADAYLLIEGEALDKWESTQRVLRGVVGPDNE